MAYNKISLQHMYNNTKIIIPTDRQIDTLENVIIKTAIIMPLQILIGFSLLCYINFPCVNRLRVESKYHYYMYHIICTMV